MSRHGVFRRMETDCVLRANALCKSLTDSERREAYFVLMHYKWPRVFGYPPKSWRMLLPRRFLWFGGKREAALSMVSIISDGDMDASFSEYFRKKMLTFGTVEDCYRWVKENSLG